MERLTYDFCINGMHCWQVKGADNLECGEVCESRNESGCIGCPIANAFDRLAAIEDILGDDYNLDRLRELVEADRDGRCVVFQPGHPVVSEYYKEGDFCIREATGVISKKEYMARLKGEQDGTH